MRSPKIADPTRTCVAPNDIALAKSPDIPMESCVKSFCLASFAKSAKCRLASSSTGGMHIKPITGRSNDRHSATKVSTSLGEIPAFCGSSPVLT